MEVSKILINKIKEFEGCRLKAYRDSVGKLTIGVGHTKGVRQDQVITMQQAESLLRGDLLPCEKYVNSISSMLTQGEFDALVDFAFNCGIGNLQRSTLLKRVQSGDKLAAKREFLRWNKAGGKVLIGLTLRREWESKRFGE